MWFRSVLIVAVLAANPLGRLCAEDGLPALDASGPASFLGLPAVGLRVEEGDAFLRDAERLWITSQQRAAFRVVARWRKAEPRSPHPWVLSARLHFEAGRYRRTLKHGARALRRQPHTAGAYYWRGLAYEARGRLLEAANELRAALIAEPDLVAAEAALERVQAALQAGVTEDE